MTTQRIASSITQIRGRPDAAALPPGLIPILGFVLLTFGPGPNFGLALLCILVLLAGGALLWCPGGTPVLFMLFGLAWLGASVSVFYSNWLNLNISDFALFSSNMESAVFLSLFSLSAIGIGMRFGAGGWTPREHLEARASALSQPVQVWFRVYLVAFGVSIVLTSAMTLAPALGQVVLGFVQLRWAFYFMLVYATVARGLFLDRYLVIAFFLELLIAFGSYLAEFKTVFLVTIAAIVASSLRISGKNLVTTAVFFVLMSGFGVVWTSVKMECRGSLQRQLSTKGIEADYLSRLANLANLTSGVNDDVLVQGLDKMLRRISYVEFFGAALNYVPEFRPHTGGTILLDAVERPFMPRIFFPGKAIIDDTLRTNFFTGGLAGSSVQASISLGYIAECYIDFGAWGMMGALGSIGLMYGVIYRWLLRNRHSTSLLGMGIATAILVQVGGLENSFTKLFGGLVADLLAVWVLFLFVLPRWLPWLSRGNAR